MFVELSIRVLVGTALAMQFNGVAATAAKSGAHSTAGKSSKPRTLDEAKQWVRQAHDDNLRGRHDIAIRLARDVLEQFGNVRIRWAGPEARHFGLDVNDPYFIEKMMTMAGEFGYKINVDISGANAWEEMVYGHFGKRDWKSVVRILEAELMQGKELGDGGINQLTIARRNLAQQGSVLRPLFFVNSRGALAAQHVKGSEQPVVAVEDFARLTGARLRVYKPGKEIAFSTDQHQVTLTVGQTKAVIDGKQVAMPAAPQVVNGRHYVPLKLLTEAFGLTAKADDQALIVFVSMERRG